MAVPWPSTKSPKCLNSTLTGDEIEEKGEKDRIIQTILVILTASKNRRKHESRSQEELEVGALYVSEKY
jgi:hypothetical protein